MRRSVLRGVGVFAVVLLILAIGVRVFVPHVYVLWFEVFPEAQWPAPGQFESVVGASNARV